MIVLTSKTRSVPIAPKAALFGDAAFPAAGDIASPELLGAAVYRIKRLFMRHPPAREPRRPVLAMLRTRVAPIVTIAGAPRSMSGCRKAAWLSASMR